MATAVGIFEDDLPVEADGERGENVGDAAPRCSWIKCFRFEQEVAIPVLRV